MWRRRLSEAIASPRTVHVCVREVFSTAAESPADGKNVIRDCARGLWRLAMCPPHAAALHGETESISVGAG